MVEQIDAQELINVLVNKIARLELENAKLNVIIDNNLKKEDKS